MCSYYVDVNGKEWIIILLPSPQKLFKHDSYLFDVEKAEIVPFISNYHQEINKIYDIYHVEKNTNSKQKTSRSMVVKNQYMSFVIDNDNHILYWLQSSSWQCSLISIDIKNLENIKLIDQTLLTSPTDDTHFAIANYTMLVVGNTIQFILANDHREPDVCYSYRMGQWQQDCQNNNVNSLANFQFDVKSKKLSLIHKNIHIKCDDHVTKLRSDHLLDNLKIGDYIDVRESEGYWYLAKILDIKDKVYYDNNNDDEDNDDDHDKRDKKHVKSMKLFIHYQQWDAKWDVWITVTNDVIDESSLFPNIDLNKLKQDMQTPKHTHPQGVKIGGQVIKFVKIESADNFINKVSNCSSICDCNEPCLLKNIKSDITEKFSVFHHIALPKTQSMYRKYLKYIDGLYSKNQQTMVILGGNSFVNRYSRAIKFGGVYCKRIGNNNNKNYCQYIVNGFLKQFNCEKIFIPKDLCQLILKYYFIQNDSYWTHMTEKGENDELIETTYDFNFCKYSSKVLVNDNLKNQICIYMFGGDPDNSSQDCGLIKRLDIDIQTQSYKIQQLKHIQCPKQYAKNQHQCPTWHVVFCKKSQTIHLFDQTFGKHFCIHLEVLNNASVVV